MNSQSLSEKIILNEISGKNAAIHAYDKIIWQIRTGFLTLVFGGWAFILKGAIESNKSLNDIYEFGGLMVILSIVLSVAGFVVDWNYVKRKFRVIKSLTILQEILVKNQGDLKDISEKDQKKLSQLVGVIGDSGNKEYGGKGYSQEVFSSSIVYSTVFIGCVISYFYIKSV